MRRVQSYCPICTGTKATALQSLTDHWTKESFLLVECAICSAKYLSDPPSAEDLPHFYHNPLGVTMWNKEKRVFSLLNRIALSLDFARLKPLLKQGSRVLDLGAGSGAPARVLKKLGYEIHARDLYQSHLWHEDGIPYRQANLNGGLLHKSDILCDGAAPDLVVMRHVLEHLSAPVKVLQSCAEAGVGFIFILVPNVEALGPRLFPQSWYYWDPPRHLTFFTRKTLHLALRNGGYQPLETWNYGIDELCTSAFRKIMLLLDPKAPEYTSRVHRALKILGPKSPLAALSSAMTRFIGSNVLACIASKSSD